MKRGLAVFRGSPSETDAAARALVDGYEVLWVSEESGTAPPEVKRLLGGTWDAVVLDLHGGFDPDLLGRSQGFVAAGGTLVLRMPAGAVRSPALAVFPYTPAEVGSRMWERLEREIRTMPDLPFAPVREFQATPEQDTLVASLRERFMARRACRIALTADRGRGKSAALGRAAAGLGAIVTAAHPENVSEILRFAPDARYVDPLVLARGEVRTHLLLVDEAASLSVPMLRALLANQSDAHLAFASTVHGYEGHGRGFSLRFLPEVEGIERFTLQTPIRWGPDDPLERFTASVLLLDAEPAPFGGEAEPEPAALPRDRLDEAVLRSTFGLLVAAHYRTTPADLHRVLDAPNLHLHALLERNAPVAVCLVAEEGGLPIDTATGLASGAFRVRGHALAETLAVHSSRPDAAQLRMIRSVRTATHPEHRRQGHARQLVEHVHAHWSPDLFGTLFGATPALLRFRRSLGYELVRLGVSRGSRTGEPSAVMVRAVSPEALGLVEDLRRTLARDLPLQLTLMEGDGLALSAELREALLSDLPPPAPLEEEDVLRALRAYTHGPRPYDSVASAVREFVMKEGMNGLSASARALLEQRVVKQHPWARIAAARSMTVPAVMRALRRALRELTELRSMASEP